MARRNVHLTFAVEGNRGGVHHVAEEWLYVVVRIDLENRHRNLLCSRSGKSHEDVALAIEGGIGDGMKVVGHGDGHMKGVWIADLPIGSDYDGAGRRSIWHASHQEIVGADHDGAFDLAEAHAGTTPLVRTQALSDDANLASRQREAG